MALKRQGRFPTGQALCAFPEREGATVFECAFPERGGATVFECAFPERGGATVFECAFLERRAFVQRVFGRRAAILIKMSFVRKTPRQIY